MLIPVSNQAREQRGVDQEIEKGRHGPLKKKDVTGLEAQITENMDAQVSLSVCGLTQHSRRAAPYTGPYEFLAARSVFRALALLSPREPS